MAHFFPCFDEDADLSRCIAERFGQGLDIADIDSSPGSGVQLRERWSACFSGRGA